VIKSFKDLEVYKLSYEVAMDLFKLSRKFPKEELFSLTSQLVRASRSVSANIAEGWSKRHYENKFKNQLIDALGSNGVCENWILFARECGYISNDEFEKIGRQI
jgi:four helix bundle protein